MSAGIQQSVNSISLLSCWNMNLGNSLAQNIKVLINNKHRWTSTYIIILVEVTLGGERVDRALPCFSSLVLVPVKILPLPVMDFPRIA